MKTKKKFDCVRMKNHIQAQLLKEWQELTQEQIRKRISKFLATSNNDVARWWRSIPSSSKARRVP